MLQNRSFVQSTNRVRTDTFGVWSSFLRGGSKPEPDTCLNLVGIDRLPPAGAKAIAEAELHELGDLGREACHDLIGKPGILVCSCGLEGFGGKIDGGKYPNVREDAPGGNKFSIVTVEVTVPSWKKAPRPNPA